MKIAYIAYWDVSQESGVLKKIISQLLEWKKQGNKIELLALTPGRFVWEGASQIPVRLFSRGNALTRFHSVQKLVEGAIQSGPDISYMRFSTFFPALRDLAEITPLILEINTDDLLEYKQTLSAAKYLYHKLTRDKLLSKASGFVFMTNELAERFSGYHKRSVVIGNGIDLSTYDFYPPPDNPQPRLVFMGSQGLEWHGVDKVLELARLRPQWKFDIIGPKLETHDGLNVTFHPYLKQSDYVGLLQSADVALGTLALYRKGMREACPLKVREYLACGLPTIIGYKDTDFPTGAPFLLEIANTSGSIQNSLPQIEEFIRSWKGRRVPRQDVIHLDIREKEDKRLAFFRWFARAG